MTIEEKLCRHCFSSHKLTDFYGRSNKCRFCDSKHKKMKRLEFVGPRKPKVYRHGKTNTRGYRIWTQMLSRCNNETNPSYKHYGGRGISVCDRWYDSMNFMEDMGQPPLGTSLDRIDSNGNYCKENCRWATATEQARNKRTTILIEWNGKKQTLIEWSQELNIPYQTIYGRLKKACLPLDKVFSSDMAKNKWKFYGL